MSEVKTVSKSEFTTDVNNGVSKTELVNKYGLSPANVKKLAKQLNVNIKREVKPKFTLVD